MTASSQACVRGTCALPGILCLLAICSSPGALPPDPDNAALLYYQAFVLCPQADAHTETLLRYVSFGAEPNELVRGYLSSRDCREAIKYAQRAAQAQECNWGSWYSRGFERRLPYRTAAHFLSRVLHADARVLGVDGDYRAAFERCLTIRRLARHVGIESFPSYSTAMEIEKNAQRCVCQILGAMPSDTETIIWLKAISVLLCLQLRYSLKRMDLCGGYQIWNMCP